MGFVIMGVVFVLGIVGYNRIMGGYPEDRVIMHHVNYNHFGR